MMAVVLAGGHGTRLKPFTATIPKPLLPLGDIPILEVLIRQLAAAGTSRVVLLLGHMAPLFAAIFGDGDRFGLRIDHCIEETPRGTAGALKQLQAVEDDFIVVNGDLLTTLDFQQLFAEHRRHRNAWATIALHDRVVNIDYGVVETTSTGVLKRYVEKPTMVYAVSMGANVLSSRCLGLITTDYLDMPQLLSAVHDAGHLVVCYKPECYWQDMGRLDDYEQASADFAASPERFLPRSSAT